MGLSCLLSALSMYRHVIRVIRYLPGFSLSLMLAVADDNRISYSRAANEALYKAKSQSRNQVCFAMLSARLIETA